MYKSGHQFTATTYISIYTHMSFLLQIVACTKISPNSFKIITNGNSDIELTSKESLIIRDYHPLLNNNNSSFELCIFN